MGAVAALNNATVKTTTNRAMEISISVNIADAVPVRLGMQIANVKLSHCEAKFGLRVWETKFGRVRRDALRIWACTPQKPNLPGWSVFSAIGFVPPLDEESLKRDHLTIQFQSLRANLCREMFLRHME